MIRGTTPIITFKIKTELDLSEIQKAEITFKSTNGLKERTWNETEISIDSEQNRMQIQMTQEDTLYFSVGEIDVQLRVKMNNDMVYASNIKTSTLDRILKEGVI